MRYRAFATGTLCLLISSCALSYDEPSFGMQGYAPETVTYLQFGSKSPNERLDEGYRFTTELAGYSRSDQAWRSQHSFVRDFPGGMMVDDVIRSIQADLQEEFVYRPGNFSRADFHGELAWSKGLAVGRDVDLYSARFEPLDVERGEQGSRVTIQRMEWASSEFHAGRDLLGAETR